MIYTYCPSCGKKLDEKIIGDEGLVKYCNVCKKPFFNHPFSCVEVLVVNESNEILLLRQHYISKTHWTLVSGYVKNGDTLEETVKKEVFEETGQVVEKMRYISSYYFPPKELIMAGFIASVKKEPFAHSNEVDDLAWFKLGEVNNYIARINNLSGIHFDNCLPYLK